MENATINLIHQHASVRHYKPDPIPVPVIETIVRAGQCAASSYNMQAYSVIAVTDAGKRAQLADICGNQHQIAEAPVFLAWCVDLARTERICALREKPQVSRYLENFLLGVTDTIIAAQNAILAAESLGYGTCYIGSVRNHPGQVIELLALPRLVFPLTGMTIGVPIKPGRIKPRLPLEAALHWERYEPEPQSSLFEYNRAMIDTGIFHDRKTPVPGKPDEMEDYGWMEHTARSLSKEMRTDLLSQIQAQGLALE